jgi:hypothetical protein
MLLAIGSQALGQENFISLSGRVTDADTRQPVSDVNIQSKHRSTGTITNTDGNFLLKLPESSSSDTLLVSCIGYKTLLLPLPAASQEGMDLRLQPAIMLLPEVAVKTRSGVAILQEMVRRIPENYDTADVMLNAFYREDIRLNGDTLNFNESVLDIYKTYHTDKDHKDQIRIIKGRKKKVDQSKDPQFYGFISNITNTAYSSLGEDLQKYLTAKNNFLNPRNHRYYAVQYRETVLEGDRSLLVLDVRPKEEGSRKGIVQVRLYIDEASKALIRCELEVTPAGIDYVNRHGKGGFKYTIMSKLIKASLDFTRLRLVVTYKQFGNKTYLHTVHRQWECVVNSKKRGITDMPWSCDLKLLVTDVNKDHVQRFSDGVSNSKSSMNHEIGADYDAAFWENYNILLPVLPDSLSTQKSMPARRPDTIRVPNRQNGFSRADTLRGQLSPLRSCYDVTFYHLDVDVNMDARSLKGSNLVRFKVMAPFSLMQLDLYANMRIEKILYRGAALPYTREYDAVFVRFPEALQEGRVEELTVYYEGVPKAPDFKIPMNGGVLWDKDEEGRPWAQVVCQGSGASLWWPNKDHLSDEPDSMRIWITVPDGFTEISNGRLERKTPAGENKTRFEWMVSYPINNYNASFCIGKYAHFNDAYINGRDTLTIDYYVMPYNLKQARAMFEQVKPMLASYERYFGKYPFPRDGFTLLESLYPMEHQSGVCIGRIRRDSMTAYSPMIWHEAAHEWWGNAISCKDMADLWMHEAFANYAESLVIEDREGRETAVAYLNDQREQVKEQEPITGVYDVNHIFYDIGDMYTKGSLMLSTFRHVLDNDTLWFNLLKGIQEHFRYQTLSADELVQYICRRTAKDYTCFFDQYLKYTALPRLELVVKEQGRNLLLQYRWQADVPGFHMPVKVTVAPERFGFIYPSAAWKTITLTNMREGDFEVDEEHFYIAVEM